MKIDTCCIIGAGEFYEHTIKQWLDSYIIAVDGGYSYAKKSGIEPDIIIGDFDSLPYKPEHSNIIQLEKEKDDTDMLTAIKHGLQKGYSVFHIYGGTGGRIDHTIANMQCLVFLARNSAQGFLYDKANIITAIYNSSMRFGEEHSGIISVFAHSGMSKGVYEHGLKYELNNADVSDMVPLGVSNEFIGKQSRVTVKDGVLLLVYDIV